MVQANFKKVHHFLRYHQRKVVLIVLVLLLCILFVQKHIQNQKATINHQILGNETKKEKKAIPVRLKIPTIHVNVLIESVALNDQGEMAEPSMLHAGWFALGTHPGEKGNAVIAGHLNGENGEAGVFVDLHKLKKGNILYVEDSKGTSLTFIVRESRIYHPGYAEEVFSGSESAHLNLITCGGLWDADKKSYTERLIIFTDMVR